MKRILKTTAPLLTVPYDAQLKMKEIRVLSALQSLGSLLKKSGSPIKLIEAAPRFKQVPCEIEPIQKSPIIDGYRNKLGASVGYDENGNLIVGHTISSRDPSRKSIITYPDICEKLDKKHHIHIVKLFEMFLNEDSKFINKKRRKLTYNGILVRSNRQNETMIYINFRGQRSSSDKLLNVTNELKDQFLPRVKNENIDVRSLYFQKHHLSMLENQSQIPCQLIYGEKYINETLCGKKFFISPESFFQINTDVAELIYQRTKRIIQQHKNGSSKKILVLDLCCGTGTLGIILSDIVDKVIGIDQVFSAIQDAKLNAQINNINNIEHIHRSVEEFLPEFLNSEEARSYDEVIAVLNPSRSGLSTPFCETLRRCELLKMIVYISCYFEGQSSENLFSFCKPEDDSTSGVPFQLVKAIPLDPFPYTTHVELILEMIR